MIWRTFRAKRQEVAGGWRRLHYEELHNMYASPDIISVIKSRRMRWAGHVARMGEMRKEYKILDGKPEGKRPFGRPMRRQEDNVRMDLRGTGWEVVWTGFIWLSLWINGGILRTR
jgi:hypothetical protein